MRNLVAIIIAVLFSEMAFSQSDSVEFTKYVGTFYVGSYDKEAVRSDNITVLIGGEAVVPVFEKFSLNGRAGYQTGDLAFGEIFLERKSSFVDFGLGYMDRPITSMMRPKRISADGHFEAPAIAAMPGGETGMYVGRKLWNGGPDVVAGLFYLAEDRAGEWNFSLKQNLGIIELSAAGFVSSVRNGISGRIKAGNASLTAFTESDSVSTALLCWKVLYLNANYNRSSDSFDNLELGVFKTFPMPYGAKILLGAGLQRELINFYVQIFLD